MHRCGVVASVVLLLGFARSANAQDLVREHGFRFPVGLETSMTDNTGRISAGVGVYGAIQYSWVRAFSFGIGGGYTPRVNSDVCSEDDVYPVVVSCAHARLFRIAMQAEVAPFQHGTVDPFASAEMGVFSAGPTGYSESGVHVGLTFGVHAWLVDDVLTMDPAIRVFYVSGTRTDDVSPVWFAFALGFTPRVHSHAKTRAP